MVAGPGLGISGFLKHNEAANSGGGQWLKRWNKKGVGEICIWLHTRAPIVPCYSHSFMNEDEYEDKETNRMLPVLRYPRFVSPDAEVVHKNQYFRNDDGSLQVPPDMDPFLLLREWLRFADHLSLDQPIFSWQNFKERETVTWFRGELSGLEKRGKKNFGHTLDTKLEYIYVVVDHDDIGSGPQLTREGKLLSQKIGEVIRQQQKMLGEEGGDPLQHPYALQWVAEDAASPMNAYKAWKREDAEFTDEVWEQISGDDFPDPTPYGQVSDGDMEKIRDAFAAAAQVELPLQEIFSDDPEVRRSLTRPLGSAGGGRRPPARMSKNAQARAAAMAAASGESQEASQPASRSAAAGKPAGTAPATPRPAAGRTGSNGTAPANGAANGSHAAAAAAAAAAPAAAPAAGPQARRKKVAPQPEPEPEPAAEVEQIACDDCGHMMLATDTKCAKCGAEYEVEDAPAPAAASTAASKPATSAPATSAKAAPAKPKPQSVPKPTAAASTASKPAGAPAASKPVSSPAVMNDATGSPNCWSCGTELGGKPNCPSCGLEQGDDIPF